MSNTNTARKRNFLPKHGNQFITVSKRLPLMALGAIALFMVPTLTFAASAGQNARKQVYASATSQAQADIKREADRNGWRDYSAKMNVFIPNDVNNYRRCTSALQISLPAGGRRDLSRLRYDISCPDASPWSVSVTVKPDVYLPILVTKNTVERGERVNAGDIQLKKHNISNLRGAFLTDPNDVVGLTAKRRLRPLQPLSTSQLDMPILVTRGQKVLMIAEQDGIEARTIGEAMKNGRKGDLIQVRNLSSKQTVSAVVFDSGVVKMPAAMVNP